MERKNKESENKATPVSNLDISPEPGKKSGQPGFLRKFLNWLAAGAQKDQSAQACSQ